MHVLWLNEAADFVGPPERHLVRTARFLAERGVRCSLIHQAGTWVEPALAGAFAHVFPAVSLRAQLEDLAPDVLAVHRWPLPLGPPSGVGDRPILRFVHERRAAERGSDSDPVPAAGMRVITSTSVAKPAEPRGRATLSEETLPPWAASPVGLADESERRDDLLLFVGDLVADTGLDLLLGALAELPAHVRLAVVGRGPCETACRALAEELGVEGRLDLLGALRPEDLSRLYCQAACVVIPSRRVGPLDSTGPEALLHQAPVVASLVAGTEGWLRADGTGLGVAPCTAESLAAGIRRVLEDPGAARARAERGAESCRRAFSEERHLDELLALLTALAT